MRFDPKIHHRRSLRLNEYDYTQQGAYFVTLVVQNRVQMFGSIVDGIVIMNDAGRMIQTAWLALPDRFPSIELDEFVIMPNHMHGILVIGGISTDVVVTGSEPGNVGATLVVAPKPGEVTPNIWAGTSPAPTLGDVVGAYKSLTTCAYSQSVRDFGWIAFDRRLWQRNYYERIIRDDREWDAIRTYILQNPQQWETDPEKPFFP